MRKPVLQLLGAALLVPALIAAAATAVAPSSAANAEENRAGQVQTLAYGSDALQAADYWPAATTDAPLVVFIHGGGWRRGDKQMMAGSAKLSHWQALGYAVASVNYRLVPDSTVEQQADDIAAALAHLRARAPALGFDPQRVALAGHSAGAHLAALVGTDPQYLAAHGLRHGDISGVIALDGAAYDTAYQLEHGPRIMQGVYEQAFGEDAARHAALSPTMQAAAPNVAHFLILHVQRDDAAVQSSALADALRSGGSNAQVQGFSGKGMRGHRAINRDLGKADYPATSVVDAFLARIFAK